LDYPIEEVYGLDDSMVARLRELGITTTQQLLDRASNAHQRGTLAEELGVSTEQVTDWVNRADLMRLNGVGREMANLLEECGVDSCKELQHRVPANLQAKLKEINTEKKIAHHAPTLTQVEAWVEQAKRIVAESEG
jgi:predicted flap endonuclease-1-like 5' DNA nuclease